MTKTCLMNERHPYFPLNPFTAIEGLACLNGVNQDRTE